MEQYFDDNLPTSDSEGELEILEGKRTVTEMQTAWGAQIFKDWLMEHSLPRDFENLRDEELDKLLERFYTTIKKKTGELYTMSAMSCIKSAIQRHVRAPPWGRALNFSNNPHFTSSNKAFQLVCKELESTVLDTTKRNCPIQPYEFRELCQKKIISTNNPYALQNLVWIHLMMHFGRRNANDWRHLKFGAFVQIADEKGRLFITEYKEYDKQTEKRGKIKPPRRMYERPKDPYCPVYAFNMYKSVVNHELDDFWQKPDSRFRKTGNWYLKQRLSVRSLSNMMKKMCTDAGLNSVHAPQCLRATAKKLLADNALDRGLHRRTANLTDFQGYPENEDFLWKQSYALSSVVATKPPPLDMNEVQTVGKPFVHGYIKEEEITFENEDPLAIPSPTSDQSSNENICSMPSLDSFDEEQKVGTKGTDVKQKTLQVPNSASHSQEAAFVVRKVDKLSDGHGKSLLLTNNRSNLISKSESTDSDRIPVKRKYKKRMERSMDPLAIPSTSSSSKRKKPRVELYDNRKEEEMVHNNDNMMTLQVTDTSGRTQEAIFFCSDEGTHGLDQQEILSETPKESKPKRKYKPRSKSESTRKRREEKEDMFHVFGMYVAKTLRDINDDNTFRQVRIQFNDILLDAMAGKYKTINRNVTQSMSQSVNLNMTQNSSQSMNPQAPYIFVITQNNSQTPVTAPGRKILPNASQPPVVQLPYTPGQAVPRAPVPMSQTPPVSQGQLIQNINGKGQLNSFSAGQEALNSNPGLNTSSAAVHERLIQGMVTPPLLDCEPPDSEQTKCDDENQ